MYISTTFYLSINHAFLNGQGNVKYGSGEITEVKQFKTKSGNTPYISAQAFRKWLRTTVTELVNQNYYYDRLGKKLNLNKSMRKKPEKVWIDPVYYIEDDLFGYSHPLMEIPDQDDKRHMNVVSMNRLSPLQSTQIIPIEGTSYIQNYDGWINPREYSSLPFNTQIMGGIFQGSATLDLNRIGVFQNYGDIIELDPHIGDYYTNKDLLEKTVDDGKIVYQLANIDARRIKIARLYFDALLNIYGGAKSTQFVSDLSPRITISAVLHGANNLFHGLIDNNDQLELDGEKLIHRIQNMKHLIASNIYIGYRSGTLDNKAESKLRKLNGKKVTENIEIIVCSPGKAFDELFERIQEELK